MNHVKSFEEMNPEQQFAWNAGRLAASQQIAEQQQHIEQLRLRNQTMREALQKCWDAGQTYGEIRRIVEDALAEGGQAE